MTMLSLRRVRARMGGLVRWLQKPVSVPIVVCVLVLVALVVIDLEVRDLSSQAAEQRRAAPAAAVAVGSRSDPEDADAAAQAAAMARVEEVLAEEPVGREEADQAPQNVVQPAQPPGKSAGAAASEDVSEGEVEALAQVLKMRLAEPGGEGVIGLRTCKSLAAMNNTRGACVDTSCPHRFPSSVKARVRQLLAPRFRLTPEQLDMVSELAKGVVPKKYIFVTAASSNHYNESQALVFNLKHFVFNKLPKDSYSFLYFDLGLKPVERRRVEKNCGCTVMSMNLKAFPKHTWKLMCYAWKPFIIRALLPKTDVLVYMDASVRFRADLDLDAFFATARRRGAQFLASLDSIPNHTVMSTFRFYQEPPCLFWPFPELLAGFSVFHNEPFMTRVVVDPWVSCAFNMTCMCPVDPHAFRLCPHTERRVGVCHRFDLSSLTLQMASLYGAKFGQLVIQDRTRPRIRRDDRMGYFTD